MPQWLEHRVDGVSGSTRLVDYLKERLVVVPVTEIGDLITRGFVATASAAVGRTEDRLASGELLRIQLAALEELRDSGRWNPPLDAPVEVIAEDDELVVVDKAAGVHVHPLGDRRDRTVINALVWRSGARGGSDHSPVGNPWGRWRPHVVSRLDCVVSGLLLVAKGAAVKAAFVREQKRGGLSRLYRAMVAGQVAEERGVIDAAIGREPGRGWRRTVLANGGQPAITEWRVLARRADRTLVELAPKTGRTHQLRVHLASIGHPIVGDDLYAFDRVPARLDDGSAKPIALRAVGLGFRHPRSGDFVELRVDLPAGFGDDPETSASP